jgi:16S rRNA (guanine527-N7)-methyltransferase
VGEFSDALAEQFAPISVLSGRTLALLESHYELLLQWNRKLNLTRITDLDEAVQLHYCESLFLADFLPKTPLKLVDVGSGPGFPGIPIAIARPDCSVDLVECHQRKAVFLTEVVRRLALPNVRVVVNRAENVDGAYDWLVSRAVNPSEIMSLKLAPEIAILGSSGVKLPWGHSRALFHVSSGG